MPCEGRSAMTHRALVPLEGRHALVMTPRQHALGPPVGSGSPPPDRWRVLGDAGDRQGPRPRRPLGGVPLGACPTLAPVSVTRVAPALDRVGSGST
jgi:hypothetical protein